MALPFGRVVFRLEPVLVIEEVGGWVCFVRHMKCSLEVLRADELQPRRRFEAIGTAVLNAECFVDDVPGVHLARVMAHDGRNVVEQDGLRVPRIHRALEPGWQRCFPHQSVATVQHLVRFRIFVKPVTAFEVKFIRPWPKGLPFQFEFRNQNSALLCNEA